MSNDGASSPAGEAVRDWVVRAARRLDDAGVDTARLDARLLIASVLGGGVERVLSQSNYILDAAEQAALASLLSRRESREPMSHILGVREFWSLPFHVTPATLIPRPDSETLIEAVLDAFPDKAASLRILDLGTGSGCLLLSLLHEYGNATGLGVDIGPDAVSIAEENAESLGLGARSEFICGGWDAALYRAGAEGFDVVVSNPPYIPDDDIPTLMPEVAQFEPHAALAGGVDGLDAYRAIINLLPAYLKKGGRVFFEVGQNQDVDVVAMLEKAGCEDVSVRGDSAGIGRCVSGFCQGVSP